MVILLMKHVMVYSRNYANIDMTSFDTTNILHRIVGYPLVSLTSLKKKKGEKKKASSSTSKGTLNYFLSPERTIKGNENSICALRKLGIDFLNMIDEAYLNH